MILKGFLYLFSIAVGGSQRKEKIVNRFVECREGLLINTERISYVNRGSKRHDDCTIYLNDGSSLKAPCYVYEDIAGENHIVQVIPSNGKYETVYADTTGENGGKPWAYDCDYFAVYADGQIRPLENNGEYFEFAGICDNYVGFRPKEKADEQQERKKQIMKDLDKMSDGDLLRLWQQWQQRKQEGK